MDCSPPGSSVHGDSPGKNPRVGSLSLLQGIFPTQGLNPVLPHCRQILYQLSHQGSPRILEWVPIPSLEDLPNPGIKCGQVISLILPPTGAHVGQRGTEGNDSVHSSGGFAVSVFSPNLFILNPCTLDSVLKLTETFLRSLRNIPVVSIVYLFFSV